MTVAHVLTVAFVGIEAREVDVQVHMSDTGGLKEGMAIVGLPDKAVAESRERVRAALHAIGLALPNKRITVNLSPADLPKEGSHYDLPIALGLLVVMGVLPAPEMAAHMAVGELSLDGAIVPVTGVLPAAIKALELERAFICPHASGAEAAWADGLEIIAAPSLVALVNHLKGVQVLSPPTAKLADENGVCADLRDVKGQETAKRALEIAAAGGHNLLMIGPPGAGKSMLASRLPGLLPPLDAREALEVSMVQSLAGELKNGAIGRRRPFRNPHHSASMAALVGGGLRAKPGEVSLAHLGVLFLDELPEFQRQVLDSLRQPLETGETLVARANAHVRYPSRVQLVAAMNPCRRVAQRPHLYSSRKVRRPVGYPENPMSVGEHLLRKRRLLSLLQRQAAERIGVGLGTYLTWEMGTRRPSIRQWPPLIAYLGYDPVPQTTEPDRIDSVRRKLGWSMQQVADFIGIDQGTLARWRTGRTSPVYTGDRLDAFLALDICRNQQLALPPAGHEKLTLGEQLKRHRCASGISQRSMAQRLGMTRNGLRNWEQDRRRPEAKHWPKIIAFLGYNPLPAPRSVADRIEHQRHLLGWTYNEVARFVRVDHHTVLRWVRRGEVRVLRRSDVDRFLHLRALYE